LLFKNIVFYYRIYGGFMENGSLDRYVPLETALKGVGLKVDAVENRGKRTVITVSRCGQSAKNPVFPAINATPTEIPPEERGANGR
jgi:hypothetical protein